jgi:hypothetical protein
MDMAGFQLQDLAIDTALGQQLTLARSQVA